jgi:hypothetical protein
MADRYVDDGGNNSDGTTWANAYTSINALQTAEATFLTTAGNRVFFGHDSNCQATNVTHLDIIGAASGLTPVQLISATQGSSPAAYQVASSSVKQIDTTEGAYNVTFNGAFSLYGLRVAAGGGVLVQNDGNEFGSCDDCMFVPGVNGSVQLAASGQCAVRNLTVDLSAESSTQTGTVITGSGSYTDIQGLTFVNPIWRTGTIFGSFAYLRVSGADFSAFVSGCEITGGLSQGEFTNCKMVSGWAANGGGGSSNSFQNVTFVNCGTADAPQSAVKSMRAGALTTSTTVYRTGGASVDSVPCSWTMAFGAELSEGVPCHTPWIYGVLTTTGSKTFTVYVANNTGDLTDAEIWLEVEYMATADSPVYTLATDHRATITTTAANQADDTGSTWNGATLTYMQSLAVTATVGEEGLYRARVAVNKATSTIYIDPKVTVSS